MSSCLLVLPSGKWFKLPCFDHLFSLCAHTQARKVKTVPQKTGSVLQTINFLEGEKKKKSCGEKCFTANNLFILLFPPALVPLAAGRSRFHSIAVQHSEAPMGFVRLRSFTGHELSRRNFLLL